MALFHFTVTQTKRSKGQSAIASAAYRSGEKLYSEYYGEYSDYTRKRGVICSDILLPPHAPKEYADRQTLWNAVEKAERGKNAQLAYSFEISLQNEFSLEENIALAREFLFREFVSRGMTVDVSFHEKECEDGGTPNPHFHFLCPIRPMEQDGTWGIKQRREYVLDEEGNRIRDQNGEFVFNAVPTTDWGSPETLEHWREAWAEMCNAKFAEKGLTVRIDHRSYERQGVDLLPTIHEGATVRAMEKKGIRTEKGEFNRWIKATNAVIKDIRKKISLLFDWITEIKAELAKPQTPDLVSLLNDYYTQRKAGAYSQKGKISNLKEMNETYNYLRANGIYTLEDLESRLQSHRTTVDGLKTTMDSQNARMKAIRSLNDYSATYKSLKPVYDGLQKIKFEKSRAKYKTEHADKLKMFYTARRKLTEEFPDGKVDMGKLSKEYDTLEQEHETTYAEFKTVREDLVLTAHQQRNIQIAGGDEQNLDVSHGQCVQGPGSYTAAGDHVLTKEVQLGVTNADQRGSLGILVEIGGRDGLHHQCQIAGRCGKAEINVGTVRGALTDHIHHNAGIGKDLQVAGQAVALELHILHTDHHQAGLNIDFGNTIHNEHSNLPQRAANSGERQKRAVDVGL